MKLLAKKMHQSSSLTGTVRVPGDKSISHRSIMLGAIAEGETRVSGFLDGADALATLNTFKSMGVNITGPKNGCVVIQGVGLHGLQAPLQALDLGNSGTSMRLLAGLLAGQRFNVTLVGDESLSGRPMGRVADPLSEMGAKIVTRDGGKPPLKINGGCELQSIDYVLPMASAQVKSSVLLAGLYAKGRTSVTEPSPTRDHTERMLEGFGYHVERNAATISLEGGGELRGCEIDVPADISSAAFFMVAASIVPNAHITLTHVGVNPTRTGIVDILRLMGANIILDNQRVSGGEPVADITVKAAPLKGIVIPAELVPLAIDEFPVIFIAAACADGETVLTDAEELRVKESDRIQAMIDGLVMIGIDAVGTQDGAVIHGGEMQTDSKQVTINCHHDHRIAMAFAIASARAKCDILIDDCDNIATSFPNFVALGCELGLNLESI